MKRRMMNKNNKELLEEIIKRYLSGEYENGSAIQVDQEILDDYFGNSPTNRLEVGGNIFYRHENLTFVKVKDNLVTLIDSCIKGNRWIAEEFQEAGKTIGIRYTKKSGKSRIVFIVSMQNVEHLDQSRKNKVISKNHSVSLSLLLEDLHNGVIDSLERSQDDAVYSIAGRQSHHKGADWDNRLNMTEALRDDEHLNTHIIEGHDSRQIACDITSVEDMRLTIEYLKKEVKFVDMK